MEDLISYGMTVFTFVAEYILCGVIGKENCEQTFYKVNFTLSDIIEWGEESVFAIEDQFELISKSNDIQKTIYSDKDESEGNM